MTTGAEYYAEAVSWEGTPFHWQAALKGVGADCKGLAWGAARILGLPEALSPWAAMDAPKSGVVPVGTLRRGLGETLQRVTEPLVGDLVVLIQGGRAQHLAIYGGDEIVHTYVSAGKVKRTSTRASLRLWPLDSVWRFASLEAV